MIHLLYRYVILSLVIFSISGCMSNADKQRYLEDQEQARSDNLALQARKKQRSAQNKVYASNAENLIRTCANTSEATISNEGKLLTQCQSLKLLPGKWEGEFELGGNKFTIDLNITDLNGSGVDKDIPAPYLIFPTKVDVVSHDSSNDFNRQIVTLLSGDFSVTYLPDARILHLNIEDYHAPSSGSHIRKFDMALARLENDNFLTGLMIVEGKWKSEGKSYSFDHGRVIRLKPVSPQDIRISSVNFDAFFNAMMRSRLWDDYGSLGYLFERLEYHLDHQLGDDIEKRLQMANKLVLRSKARDSHCVHCFSIAIKYYMYILDKLGDNIEKRLEMARVLDDLACSECRTAALKNYLLIAGKIVDVRLYLRISTMYKDGLGTVKNDAEALRWESLSEPIMAQALAVCKSKAAPLMKQYVVGRFNEPKLERLGIEIGYHKNPVLEGEGIPISYYKEPQLINMSKAFNCDYVIKTRRDNMEAFLDAIKPCEYKDINGHCDDIRDSGERFAGFTITIEPGDQKNDTVRLKGK